MVKKSAGIMLYRLQNKVLQILLVHPGGPFWANKDAGAWSIPKGEFDVEEDPLAAALRELKEETGVKATGPFIPLSPVKQKSGKLIYAWAMQLDIDATTIRSNTFEMEWPPRSGKKKFFPEVDKAEWFDTIIAKDKIIMGQVPFISELEERIGLIK